MPSRMKPSQRKSAMPDLPTIASSPDTLCVSSVQLSYAPAAAIPPVVEPPIPSQSTPTNTGEELLTKRELAVRLKKTPRCVEQWMRRRYLPYIKIGHTVLFKWRDVLEALERLTIR